MARRVAAPQRASVAHFAAQTPPIACSHAEGARYAPAGRRGRKGNAPASCDQCKRMYEHFRSLHRKKGQQLNIAGGKSNKYTCWRWNSVEGAWDVARLFSRQPVPAATAHEADASALLNIIFYYEGAFGMKGNDVVSTWINQVLEVRNGAFGHVAACELDDATSQHAVGVVQRFLRELSKDAGAGRAATAPPEILAAVKRIEGMVGASDRYFIS